MIDFRIYIGQTTQTLEQRWRRHKSQLNSSTHLHRAMKKYGIENFEITEIDSADSQEELNKLELEYILATNSHIEGFNVNISGNRCGGDTYTHNPNLAEIKLKLSKSLSGKNNPRSKSVKAINILDNKEIIYDTILECQKDLGLPSHASISNRCIGKIKSAYKNEWEFEYV